jgi:nicotinamide mononucleotide transporter
MQAVLDFLYQTVFSLGGTPVTIAELGGFVLGVATVYLVAKANIWTFPVGIVQCAFFFVLFLDAKLYADMWLQVFFIGIQFVGWWAWLKAGPNRTKLQIRQSPRWLFAASLGAVAIFAYFMIPVLREAHGAYPGPDATSTGLSVMAQFLLTFKFIENWYLWIIADLIYIPLYAAKDLYFTAILYVVFLGLCIMGLHHWKAVQRGDKDGNEPNSAYGARNLIDNPSFETSRHQGGWEPA